MNLLKQAGHSDGQNEVVAYAETTIEILAKELIGKCGITPDDLEDIEQEMMIDLLRRLGNYDRSKAKLTTFIKRVLERKIANILRQRCTEKEFLNRSCLSLEKSIQSYDTPGEHITLGDTVTTEYYDKTVRGKMRSREDERQLVFDVRQIVAVFPDELRIACEHLLSGKSVSETANLVGIKRSTFYEKVLAPIREAFQAADLKNYL
ncbi:MAG: hypothetical protein OEV87_00610 [Phycisphaerae bacterium]|nr:hypothetical protein [Phycisphaerae bacterium]